MKTAPPFLSVQSSDWYMFCDFATAKAVLAQAQGVLPNAVLYDLLKDDPSTFPLNLGAARPPISLVPDPNNPNLTGVSIFAVAGTQLEVNVNFGQAFVVGLASAYAGELADRKTDPRGLDQSLGRCVAKTPSTPGTDPSTMTLQVYTPPTDQLDPEFFWRA